MFSLTQNYLTRGFWGDEAWTSLISQLPYVQMLKTTAADFHPPGYYTIIEILYKFVAPTEVNTRLVSIVFYLLTIFLVYKLASYASGSFPPVILNDSEGSRDSSSSTQNDRKELLGLNNFGLISAVVVALNPIFFTYAFEARNYTMFAFAATGSIYYLVQLSEKFTKKTAAIFVLFSTLGIYTHYYMFFVLASQFFYILLWDRKILLKMIGVFAIVGVSYLPWIPFLFTQLTSVGESYWIGGIDKRTHFEAILRILGGEHKTIFRPILFWLSSVLVLTGIIQHALRHPSTSRSTLREEPSGHSTVSAQSNRSDSMSSGPRFEKQYLLIWSWAIVPFILASLPGFRIGEFALPYRPIFFWRYLIPASIPLAMVMVHTAQKFPKILMMIPIGSLILLSVAIDTDVFRRYPHSFKQVYANDVVPNIQSEDEIVTVLPSFAEVLYYRNQNHLENNLVVLEEGLVQFSGKSLLDANVENGVVQVRNPEANRYFEMRRGDSGPFAIMRH
ncbi:hypothetical protein A3J17_00245 [Candidatus Curtissbacteria bacterium RIFCSPLOWO2_02_FULL_40_11]|nr:MAG: hypothetical protein A3J17_00245 [Candidatus Curtissbacteria bacterium RIFCSPLOWO2_02_FULL_40_11]